MTLLKKIFIYFRYRNFCNTVLKNAKTEYFNKQLNDSKGNTKQLWKTIKSLSEQNTSKNSPIDLIHIVDNPKSSLNKCNSHFVSVGPSLAQGTLNKIAETEENLVKKVNILPSQESFFMHPTDESELELLIKSLSNDKAPGIDEIGNKLVKLCSGSIIKPLCHIINMSLSQGIFPDCWKTALVIPIHKGGCKSSPDQYRPISLLNTFSKILERIVNKRLAQFVEKNNILSHNQYGFRKEKSTEEAVLNLVNLVSSDLDKGKSCIGVFLDLAKAFDTVSLPILLEKLSRYGIRGIPHNWFTSYLTMRKQVVKINNSHSDTEYTHYGVPQGSILGPLLFNLYINDISDCVKNLPNSAVFCYADDTALIFSDSNWEKVLSQTEKGITSINSWLDNNLLTLNPSKTHFICFHKTIKSAPTNLTKLLLHHCNLVPNCNCNVYIDRKDSTKYLGVIIDEKLTFTHHVTAVAKRSRKLIPIMKKLRDISDKKTLKLVYTSLCESILTYCILAWGGASKTHFLEIERAQRSILKVLYKKPFLFSTDQLYLDCEALTVRQLFIFNSVIYTHKKQLLFRQTSSYTSKRTNRIPVPTMRLAFGQRSPQFLQPFLYNKLLKHCKFFDDSCHGAKKKIKLYLLKLDYYDTEALFALY